MTRFYAFPFLLGRAFIEAPTPPPTAQPPPKFPFLAGRAFIEAGPLRRKPGSGCGDLLSFSEGLSLRPAVYCPHHHWRGISLPFWRGFH